MSFVRNAFNITGGNGLIKEAGSVRVGLPRGDIVLAFATVLVVVLALPLDLPFALAFVLTIVDIDIDPRGDDSTTVEKTPRTRSDLRQLGE